MRVRAKAGDVDAHVVCELCKCTINAIGRNRPTGAARVVADGVEQRRCLVIAGASYLKVGRDGGSGGRWSRT